MEIEEKTILVSVCPKCGKYHLIASIKHLTEGDLRAFTKLAKKGFKTQSTTRQDAKDNFGYCKN
jgi:hypothetical protein